MDSTKIAPEDHKTEQVDRKSTNVMDNSLKDILRDEISNDYYTKIRNETLEDQPLKGDVSLSQLEVEVAQLTNGKLISGRKEHRENPLEELTEISDP